jgi:signal transduction histidine kinase
MISVALAKRSLKAYLPSPAVLGILLMSLGAFSSVSWLMYAQFRSLLIGQGVQITEQFAQTGLSVFLVKDLSGIRQTAAVFRNFPGVRHLAVVDARGTVRFEDGVHARATYHTPPGIPITRAGLVAEDTRTWHFAAPIVISGPFMDSPFAETPGAGTRTIGRVVIIMDKGRLRFLEYLLLPLNIGVWILLTIAVLRWAWKVHEVDRQKSAFMATVTHEMRTPLHGIIGNTQLALEALEVYEEPPDATTLHAVMASALQLSALIDHILDAHQLQAGKMGLRLEPTDLRDLTAEAVTAVSPSIAKNGNRLIQNIDTDGLVTLDRGKLLQVLQNLLSNAAKFTHQGIVTLHVEHRPTRLRIAVQDTGIGIPDDQQAAIFEPFRKVDTRDTRKYEGSGLGLAISRGFCELMGGTLRVESRVNVGSTFTVAIPLPISGSRHGTEPER